MNSREPIPGRSLPVVVGVVNLSPESPNQDSVVLNPEAAVERSRQLVAAGAAIIDLGAQSSYFDAPILTVEEEIRRLIPALARLKAGGFHVSVDTWRAGVARAAIDAGVDILNDSDGLQDPAMIEVLANWRGPVILPFISGPNPHDPRPFNYVNPLADIIPFLRSAVARAQATGLTRLILDPGTGYRYPDVSPEEKERYQVKVYRGLSRLRKLGFPLLVALPRKDDPRRTMELVRMIVTGADYVRAHDPAVIAAALGER